MDLTEILEEGIEESAIVDAYLLGIGGKRTAYLPKQFTSTYADGNSYTVKYEYVFEGDYISEIRIDDNGDQGIMKLYYEE